MPVQVCYSDMQISGTLFLLAEAFSFAGELRTRFNCSSWPTARYLIVIYTCLMRLILPHILVNAETSENFAVWKMHSTLLLSMLNTFPQSSGMLHP